MQLRLTYPNCVSVGIYLRLLRPEVEQKSGDKWSPLQPSAHSYGRGFSFYSRSFTSGPRVHLNTLQPHLVPDWPYPSGSAGVQCAHLVRLTIAYLSLPTQNGGRIQLHGVPGAVQHGPPSADTPCLRPHAVPSVRCPPARARQQRLCHVPNLPQGECQKNSVFSLVIVRADFIMV